MGPKDALTLFMAAGSADMLSDVNAGKSKETTVTTSGPFSALGFG